MSENKLLDLAIEYSIEAKSDHNDGWVKAEYLKKLKRVKEYLDGIIKEKEQEKDTK